MFHESDKFSENVKLKFNLYFSNFSCPNRNTVQDLINKLSETRLVHNALRSGRSTVLMEVNLDQILDIMLRSVFKSMRKLVQECNLLHMTAYKTIIKELKSSLKCTIIS